MGKSPVFGARRSRLRHHLLGAKPGRGGGAVGGGAGGVANAQYSGGIPDLFGKSHLADPLGHSIRISKKIAFGAGFDCFRALAYGHGGGMALPGGDSAGSPWAGFGSWALWSR